MSKMSQLHMELTEQANELGFESIEEAEANGYHVQYNNYKKAHLAFDMARAQEEAHKTWLEEKGTTLRALYEVHARAVEEDRLADASIIKNTIDFIKKGEV